MKKLIKRAAHSKAPLKQRLRAMFGRRFRAGSYSAFAAAMLVVIAVIANMIAGALPASVTQIDMTGQSLYSLSEQTKRIAASLDQDVNLYLLATSGSEDSTITRLLNRYADLSDHIRVSYVDPAEQPTFLENYDLGNTQLYANSVIVECGERYRLVGYDAIFVTSYSMDYSSYGYTTTTEFNGENELTNAIHYVSSDNLPKVRILTGHGESELSESLLSLLKQDNLETDTLTLLSEGEVPEDTDAVIINAPESDLSDDEADALIAYLEGGGRIVLVTDYIAEGEMENLLRVTGSMGLTTEAGLVIEGNSSMHLSRYPYYLLPDCEEHEITSALRAGGYYILMPLSQPITETGESDASVSYLLTTSSDAYAKADGMQAETTEREDGDAQGPFHVAAASERGEGRLCWFSGADFLIEAIDRTVGGANGNLFLNAVNWMCDQEETISIRAKSMENNTLTVTGAQSTLWSIIMIGLIPLGLIAAGTIISIRRKRR
ncbi:MAG: GldG family protein [Candidatus Faecivicinus sp.]